MKRAAKEGERVKLGKAEVQKLRAELVRMQKLEKEQIKNNFAKDRTRFSYNTYTVKDPLKEYMDAHKYSMSTPEDRFDSSGCANAEEGRVYGNKPDDVPTSS